MTAWSCNQNFRNDDHSCRAMCAAPTPPPLLLLLVLLLHGAEWEQRVSAVTERMASSTQIVKLYTFTRMRLIYHISFRFHITLSNLP